MDRHLTNGDIQAATSYLKCSYVMSQPTGVVNLSVPSEFLTKKDKKDEKEAGTALVDPFADWNGPEMKTCDDLVYKVTLTNTSDKAQKFKLELSLASANDTPNLLWPVNGYRGQLGGNETTHFLLPKIEPSVRGLAEKAELDKLEMVLKVKAPEEEEEKKNGAGNQGTGAGPVVQSNSQQDKIAQVKEVVGPAADEETIGAILASVDNDVEKAVMALLSM